MSGLDFPEIPSAEEMEQLMAQSQFDLDRCMAEQQTQWDAPAGSGDAGSLQPLALRPRQAAKALGIGERLLWSLTNRGEIPHLRLGRTIVYPVDRLRVWLAERCDGKKLG